VVSEWWMKPFVDRVIKEKYGVPRKVVVDVPVLPAALRRPDIVYVFKGFLVTVELKIWDWRKAVQQALFNRFFSLAYVALQWKRRRNINMEVFRKLGVGLIAVNSRGAKILAEPQPPISPELARTVGKLLGGR